MKTISIEEAFSYRVEDEKDSISAYSRKGSNKLYILSNFVTVNHVKATYFRHKGLGYKLINGTLFKAALCQKQNLIMSVGDSNWRMNFMGSHTLLLSNNSGLYNFMADYNMEYEIRSHFMYFQNWVIKGILKDDVDVIEQNLEKLDQYSSTKGPKMNRGIYEALRGIVEKDSKRIVSGIELNIKNMKRRAMGERPLLMKYIDLVSVSLLKLASYKGVEVDFDHEFVPAELSRFEETKQIPKPVYPFLEELDDEFEYMEMISCQKWILQFPMLMLSLRSFRK